MIEYLFEATIYAGSGTRIIRYTSGSKVVTVGGYDYLPRIVNPGSLKIMMFGEGTTMGQSKIGSGEIRFANTDGGLDNFIQCGFDGRFAVIKELIAGVTIGLTIGCAMEQPSFSTNEMAIRLKDPQLVFNKPFQTSKYRGTNVLPGGVDGTADIKGKPKPVIYGPVSNDTPICVNTSRLIYQENDGALYSIPAVYDKGVALTLGTDYSSQADMEANQPAPGYYRCWLAGGMFRLGSSPIGQITCDAVQGTNAAARTVAQISKLVALRVLTAGDLVDQDFTDLDTLNSSVVGISIKEETTIGAVLDELLNSIGGWYGFDSSNKMNVGRLDAPSGTPTLSLTKYEIIDIERLATQDEGRGLPAYKVNLNYDKNYTVQDSGSLAGSTFKGNPWIPITLPVSGYWQSLVFGNGIFVAIDSATSNKVVYSSDGINWISATMPSMAEWNNIVYGGGLFVAIAYNSNKVAYSTNGINWTASTLPSTANWISLAYGGGKFVAIAYNSDKAAYSSDGNSWSAATLPASANWSDVAYGNGTFVAIASGTNGSATSTTGTSWAARTMPSSAAWQSVTYGNGIFVALVASSSVAASSADGVTWDTRALPVSSTWRNISFGDTSFIATAFGSNITASSEDGITWILKTLPSVTSWGCVAYGNGTFVALTNDGTANGAILTTSIANTRALYTSKQYRTVTVSDTSVQTKHLNATEINLNTLIVSQTDGTTEATRQLTLRKVDRDYLAIHLKRSAISTMPDLGKVIKISYPRFGYTGGKLFVFIGFNVELETNDLTLYLWG